jgi:hypothetical protein
VARGGRHVHRPGEGRPVQPKEVSDLTLAIGVINTYNRLSIGFRHPPGDEAAA